MNIQGKYIKYENYVALEEKCADLSERLNLISDLMEYALRVFSQEQKKKEKPYANLAMLVALLEAASYRIAELEAREVNLSKLSVGEVMHMSGFSRDYAEGWCAGNDNAIHEIRTAGIKVKG
ncbi:TPA: hypothetical protein LT059_004631 [Salmonella enterica subsp. enterica serovar Kodjovi]|nr:hypothetical protein [Salmonella enterica subsp. enterica serovar Kodjovi]